MLDKKIHDSPLGKIIKGTWCLLDLSQKSHSITWSAVLNNVNKTNQYFLPKLKRIKSGGIWHVIPRCVILEAKLDQKGGSTGVILH